jgi:transcription antitermination protein NusB
MPARSKARKRALDILYAADLRGDDPVTSLETAVAEGEGPTNPYTEVLVRGVVGHRDRVDEVLARYAEGWTLDRMPAVDRTALRIGAFELLFSDDVPAPVAVSEAVALVRNLSTDDSPSFVNGVLGSMLRDREALVAEV